MLRGPREERVVYKEKSVESGEVKLITTIRAQKLLRQGCKGFLCNVVKTEAP